MSGDKAPENRVDFVWPLGEAKARLSELIDKVEQEGPQVISRRGREVAVVVPVEEWRRKSVRAGSLAQFFAESPLRDSGLVVDRERNDPQHREVAL